LSPIDIQTLLSFKHKHLLQIHGGGSLEEQRGASYIVSDPIAGVPFLEWFEASDPSLEEWTQVLCQTLEALGYLHDRGWVHLRVTDKILRVNDGQVLLTNHGALCHEFEPSNLRGEQRSPFVAPEMCGGGHPLDQRADYFAVGVLIYRVVTGAFPFQDHEAPNLDGPKSFRLSIPHSPLSTLFSPLLQNLLASEPALRKRTRHEIIEQLQIIAGQDPSPREANKLNVLVPQFIGRRGELSTLNSAVSFLTDGLDFPKENEGLLQTHRATRLVVLGNDKPSANNAAWISIHGEKGLGKARLISEFARRLMEKGIDFIRLSGQGLRTAVFDSVSEIIERLLSRPGALKRTREAPESTRRELLRFLPGLVTKIPPPASRAEDDDEFAAMEDLRGERDRMIDGLSSFMIQEARAHPYVLVVTDSDALTELSQTLISHLARRVSTSRRWQQRFARGAAAIQDEGPIPLFIVTSSDSLPEDDGGAYDDGRQLMRLSPLQHWEAARLIGDALGVDRIEEKSSKWLTMVSAGHPGRLVDTLREYLSKFERAEGRWRLSDSVFQDVSEFDPETKDSQKVKSLPNPLRLLLATFAYLERPLHAKLLLSSLGLMIPEGVAALTQLLERRWIRRRGDQRLILAHRSLGLAGTASFTDGERAKLEERILSALVAQYERERHEEQLVELVEFAARIGNAASLARFGLEAAARYERIRADDRAIALYQALLATGELSTEDAYGLRVRLASCLFRNESTEESVLELRQVFEGTVNIWPAAPRMAICRRLAVILASEGRDKEAFETLEKGETLVEDLGDIDVDVAREFAALLAAKADFFLTRERNLDEVTRLCERAQKALRANAATGKGRDLALVRARLLALQGRLDFLRDKFNSAEQLTRAALAVQERYGAVLQVARSYYRLGNIELSRDREGVAEKHWHKSLKVRRQFGDRYGVAHILSNLSLSAARVGRMEKARDFILQSLRIREESGDVPGRAAALHNLGFIYESAGNLQRAVASYNECLALREELDDIHYAARVQNNLAHCLFVLGETMEARDRFVSALVTLREEDDKRGEATALSRLAEIDFHRGRFEKAVQRAGQANEIRLEIGGSEDLIESLQVKSTIELGLGNHNKAVALIYEAVELARGGRYQVQLARSLLLYGRVLTHIKEFDSAKSALLEAQSLYEAIGDVRALRCVAMEIGTVYLGVGLHSDANYLISPSVFSDSTSQKDELGYGFDKVRELHITTLLQLLNRDGDAEVAMAGALEAIGICQQNHFLTQKWRSLRLAAAAAEALGDQNEAQDFAAEAQEIVEELSTKVPIEYRAAYLAKGAV
ncbi:MAG: tetratricopeptide repeat protein, partial [Planctomycetota bacterium]|nr:tetratricopeptide repeat protein [Planctomycetota bacterium]